MSSLKAPPPNIRSLADLRRWDNLNANSHPSVHNSLSLARLPPTTPSIFRSPIIQGLSTIAPSLVQIPPLLPNNTDHPTTDHKVRQHQVRAWQRPLRSDHLTHSSQSGPRHTMTTAPRIKRAPHPLNAPNKSTTQHRLPRALSFSPKQVHPKYQMHRRIFRLL
jgi:hypothetical protein